MVISFLSPREPQIDAGEVDLPKIGTVAIQAQKDPVDCLAYWTKRCELNARARKWLATANERTNNPCLHD
jgi:hypothetical protein